MIQQTTNDVPENHEIRPLFRALTERGMDVAKVRDDETVRYISDLLTEFLDSKMPTVSATSMVRDSNTSPIS